MSSFRSEFRVESPELRVCGSAWRILAALLLFASCRPAPPAPPASAGASTLFPASQRQAAPYVASAAAGERLYRTLCSSCHGQDGRARSALGRDLDPPATDLTRCNFKYRSTPSGSLPTDDNLVRSLYVGLPGTSMPSFADLLSLPAMRALAQQVKARCERFSRQQPDPPLRRPAAAVPYGEISVARGEQIYKQQRCHSCHGATGRGDGPAARSLKDLQGRPVLPRVHAHGVFRSGFRREDIVRAFSTGLDGTPMPALPEGAVSDSGRWDLANFIVSLSHRRSRVLRLLQSRPTWYEPAAGWSLPWR